MKTIDENTYKTFTRKLVKCYLYSKIGISECRRYEHLRNRFTKFQLLLNTKKILKKKTKTSSGRFSKREKLLPDLCTKRIITSSDFMQMKLWFYRIDLQIV